MNGRRPRRKATRSIITAILIGFGIEVLTGAWMNGELLARMGAIYPPYVFEDGDWWRLVTAMFLHGDGTVPGTALHLATNLFALFQLGSLYELMFGTRRFTIMYFATGIVASLTTLFLPPHGPSVGASGAIFGIMGAFIFSVRRSNRWRHERAARGLVSQIVFWIIANIAISMNFPQIDMAAHMGGLLAGVILGAVWRHRVPPPSPAQIVIEVMPSEGPAGDPRERRNGR